MSSREVRHSRREILSRITELTEKIQNVSSRGELLELGPDLKDVDWESRNFHLHRQEQGATEETPEVGPDMERLWELYKAREASTAAAEMPRDPTCLIRLGESAVGSQISKGSQRVIRDIELQAELEQLEIQELAQAKLTEAIKWQAQVDLRKTELRAELRKRQALENYRPGRGSHVAASQTGSKIQTPTGPKRATPILVAENTTGKPKLESETGLGKALGAALPKQSVGSGTALFSNCQDFIPEFLQPGIFDRKVSPILDQGQKFGTGQQMNPVGPIARERSLEPKSNNDNHAKLNAEHTFEPRYTDRISVCESRKDFLDLALLIGYDGSNMPFVFFKNEVVSLMDRCPYKERHLNLLRAACVRTAAHTISILVSQIPGISDEQRIQMALDRLSQRFGVRGGFYAEPEVRSMRYGPKLNVTTAAAWKEFRDQLTQCQVFALAYKQPKKLEGQFVFDLANRLPTFAKQRYLDFLGVNYEHTSEPTFNSLFEFVLREEEYKSTDFGVHLMSNDARTAHDEAKKVAKDPMTSCRVRQAAVKQPAVREGLSRSADFSGNYKAPPKNVNGSQLVVVNSISDDSKCICCTILGGDVNHYVTKCGKFLRMSAAERKDIVIKAGRCFNCLGKHLVKNCREVCNCRKCASSGKAKHFYLLHDLFEAGTNKPENRSLSEPVNSNDNGSISMRGVRLGSTKAALNRITAARIINPQNGLSKNVYCQHDGGSQLSFISEVLAKELELESYDKVSFKLETLTGVKLTCSDLVKFEVQSLENEEVFALSNVVMNPPWHDDVETLPHKQDVSSYPHFSDVQLFELSNCDTVDLIIGNDNACLMTALEERVGANLDDPHAILTPLGWMACGGSSPLSNSSAKVAKVHSVLDRGYEDVTNLMSQIEQRDAKICELERVVRDLMLEDSKPELSRGDKKAKQIVEEHVEVKGNRFEIPVPFEDKVIDLPNNYTMAAKRFDSLCRKALKDDAVRDFIVEQISEMRAYGYIEPASNVKESTSCWYLPYFVTSQTKKRIVYDGRAEFGGVCINDFIMSGPDMLNSLVDVLARFRLGKFGLMADLTKCFFQIGVPEEQRDFLRILWVENDDLDKGRVVPYRFTVHPWGIKSSPYVACLAIQRTLQSNVSKACDLTIETIRTSMYMDDLIFSVDTLEKARVITEESVALFESRGFRLVKWSSNRDALSVISDFDKSSLSSGIRDLDLNSDVLDLPSTKTLGCVWETASDQFRIDCSLQALDKYTRRTMMSHLGKSFDPLGLFAPFFLKARLILQSLALEKFDWDVEVTDAFVKEWKLWVESLEHLNDIALARWYFANSVPMAPSDKVTYQLHGFCDASNKAFGTVVYLRRICNGIPCVALVLGKSRVVLRHQASWAIARKELVAAVSGTELVNQAFIALNLPDCQKYFWCDSRTVLHWIKNPDLRLDKFIARRVDRILLFSEAPDWRYCPTQLNPADVASRPDAIRKSDARKLWFEGPCFLEQHMPDPVPQSSVVCTRKVNHSNVMLAPDGADRCPGLDKLIESAPTLYALKKRVSYLSAFVEFLRCQIRKQPFVKPKFDALCLDKALYMIVGYVQRRLYGDIIRDMNKNAPESFDDAIKCCSSKINDTGTSEACIRELRSLKKYRPCVDENGLLRIEGRLSKSPELSVDAKHPLILPSQDPLTRLVVLSFHTENEHVGVQHTLLLTRRQFWIVKGNTAVKRYLKTCAICAIEKAKPIRQLMSDLPNSRVEANNKAFYNCGLDFLGPLSFVEGRSSKKAWGLLFTCLASRAIHVEIVTSLSLSEFTLAFSRFTDVRGSVRTIFSDNGTTFQAASKVLPELMTSIEFHNSCRQKGIRWEFIPPYAPAQGGIWESMVKQFKVIFCRTVDALAHKPKLMELITFASNTVRIVNERPLTPLSDDPNDFTVVTPASLLSPRLDPFCPVGTSHDRDQLRRDYRFNVALADRFWENWVTFYLPLLQRRNKWWKDANNLAPGQLVLVGSMEDLKKRGGYRMGRVQEVIPQWRNGKPLVRRAKIAVTSWNAGTEKFELDYILRDISCIAPVECLN